MSVEIAALPKVELHCHMDGILTTQMARDIRAIDPDFPVAPEDFAPYFPIHDVDSFFRWWGVAKPIDGKIHHYYPIISRYIDHLKAQNVHYFEVMIALGELPGDTLEVVDKVLAFREWVNRQEAGKIQVEFLIALGRSRPLEQWPGIEEKILRLHEAGLIVGVALAGPERGYPVRPLERYFARFHEAGVKIEIHAGEWVGAESVWDALKHGYPDRIGHGITLFDDARLIEIFQERQIHLEFCPTSNLTTGSIPRIKDHPIPKARALGMNFSINTDDPGPCRCTLSGEFERVVTEFGFDETDFNAIYANALAARFQPVLRV